jgi:hypothetical protein
MPANQHEPVPIFDRHQITAMHTAFEQVSARMRLVGTKATPVIELVAIRIVELARAGEFDPEKLASARCHGGIQLGGEVPRLKRGTELVRHVAEAQPIHDRPVIAKSRSSLLLKWGRRVSAPLSHLGSSRVLTETASKHGASTKTGIDDTAPRK